MPYYHQGDLRAWRQGEFKLHLITEGAYGQPPEREEHEVPILYRLTDDPGEKFDVASQYPDVVASILSAIEQHRQTMKERPPLFDARLNP